MPHTFDCKSPGIGALPLECAAKPKRRKRRRPKNSQRKKTKKVGEPFHFAAFRAEMARSSRATRKVRRLRETKRPLPSRDRGRGALRRKGQKGVTGFRRNSRRAKGRTFRGECVPRRRVRHGRASHSSLGSIHFSSLRKRCACFPPQCQRPPPYTVRCTLQKMSTGGRPKWQHRFGRPHPEMFVLTRA